MRRVPAEFYLISNVLQSVWKLRDILLCKNGKYTEKSAQISAVERIFIVAIEDHRFIILLLMFRVVNGVVESLFKMFLNLVTKENVPQELEIALLYCFFIDCARIGCTKVDSAIHRILERIRFGFQYLYRYFNLSFSQSDVPDLSD